MLSLFQFEETTVIVFEDFSLFNFKIPEFSHSEVVKEVVVVNPWLMNRYLALL